MRLRHLRAAFLLFAFSTAAFGDTLAVPAAQATTVGNAPIVLGAGAVRVQEVIGSGQFTVPITIIGLRIRAAPGIGPVSSASSSFKLTLSTTQAFPNTANGHSLPSTTYANNVGPDATLVYNGPGTFSSPGCTAPGPCPFDVVIPFTTPFSYDPAKGRLLIDYTTAASLPGTVKGSVDAVTFADSINSSVAVLAGDPTQASAPSVNVGGLVFGLDTGTSAYYFPHLAFAGGWQTTVTYVNYSPLNVSCQTTFYTDIGTPLLIPFGATTISSRGDAFAPGADLHEQTTGVAAPPFVSGWAVALCSSPIKASVLFRFYNGQGVAQGEAGVNAMTAPTTEFVTFAQTQTGIAYANPSTTSATVTVTVLSSAGLALGSTVFQLAPNAHGAANLGPLLGLSNFTGSVQITSNVPIVSLSLNAEVFPAFSSLPPGELPSSTPLATGH
jgi:hypothetical protein